MKTLLFVFSLLLVAVLGTGCGTVGAGRTAGWGQLPGGAIGQSTLPPDPVRARSNFYTDGSYTRSYNQGSQTTAERRYSPVFGTEERVYQNTYTNFHESYYPKQYYWGGWR